MITAKNGWSAEANSFFEKRLQGQIIYASLTGFAALNGTPFVNLFKIEGSNVILLSNISLYNFNFKFYRKFLSTKNSLKMDMVIGLKPRCPVPPPKLLKKT